MTLLSLKVISYKGERPEQQKTQQTDMQDLTLGRSEKNDLVLPDCDKFVSGHHATISYQAPDYYITDHSTNGLYINNSKKPVGKNKVKLSNGDLLDVGDYIVKVSISPQQPSAEISTMTYEDPFADLGPDPIKKVIEKNDSNTTERDLHSTDKDYSDSNYPSDYESARSSEPDHVSPLNEAFKPVQGHAEQPEPTQPDKPEDLVNIGIPENWMLATSTGMFVQVAKEDEKKQTPDPAADTQPPPDIQQSTQPSLQTKNAVEKFLLGAGLENENLSTQLTDESFYLIGKILRKVVEGTMDVMIARYQIKSEMLLDVTMIQPAENNPIKFSFNANEALVRLLGKQKSGYMPPEQAIEEAFGDLKIHQISVLSGMQMALQSVLKQFDPEELETRLLQNNPISASIPIQKRAKLWDLFEELYEEIESEARDNFNKLFGSAFAEAYEKQSKKLKKEILKKKQSNS